MARYYGKARRQYNRGSARRPHSSENERRISNRRRSFENKNRFDQSPNRPAFHRNSTDGPMQFEMEILLTIHNKHVRGVVNSGIQESRIGFGVLKLVQAHSTSVLRKKVIRTPYGIELAEMIMVNVRIQDSPVRKIECAVDSRMHPNELILGARALNEMNCHIKIEGVEVQKRKKVITRVGSLPFKRRSQNYSKLRYAHEGRPREGIEFLDKREGQRARDWN